MGKAAKQRVGKEKRKISDHRLQTIDFLRKCRKAISRLSIGLSWEIFGINIEKSMASLYQYLRQLDRVDCMVDPP